MPRYFGLSFSFRAFCATLAIFAGTAQSNIGFAQDAGVVTVQELHKELAKRDAIIVDLLNRVRALEAQDFGNDIEAGAVDIGARDDSAALPVANRPEPDAPVHGDFQIDRLQALRALERGLVEEGAQLLRPGQVEFVPKFDISHFKGMFPTALMLGDSSVVGEIEQKFDIYEQSVDLRIGLPFDAQLNIALPYRVVDQETGTGVDGMIQSVNNHSGSGFGDITIGLAKALATEQSWRPNLIGQLVWLSGSGDERDDGVYLGGGNSGLAASLNAYWRRDPVVFLMSGGYTYYQTGNAIRPGDSVDLSLGLGLAVSPETALIFSLDQSFIGEYTRDGVDLPGTDRLSSTLGLSASTILGRKLFLQVKTGLGLTEDTPEYRFGASLAYRFDAVR